jgi:hypothetical protein
MRSVSRCSMSRRGKIAIVFSEVWFVVGTAYYAHRGILQFIAVPMLLGILVVAVLTFMWVFADWRRYGWRSVLPFLICVFSLVGSFAAALRIREVIFEWPLPSYEALVRQMQTGEILVTNLNRSYIPGAESQARLAYSVAAWRDTNGVLTVEIQTEAGFPGMHSGYLFCSAGVIAPDSVADKRWPGRRQVRPQWFFVSD